MDALNNIILSDLGIVSALGTGKQATWQNLFADPRDIMSVETGWIDDLAITVGKVKDPLPNMSDWAAKDQSRCNQFVHMAYQQIKPQVDAAIEQYGADRVGVILGTSTSGTAEAESAFDHRNKIGQLPDNYHYEKQEMGAPATYLAKLAGLNSVVLSISTACSSGAKALLSGSNMIKSGLLDAVIVGGVDSLCHLTLNGFNALESLSPDLCQPFSPNRKGINIGEGAALFLMNKALMKKGTEGITLAGFGESSDAHHMSAPHPEGDGAFTAMQNALNHAGSDMSDIDYINLHGTATPLNDKMESAALTRLGGQDIPCSSTKPFTGHTLAGAGAIEAAICYLAMSPINNNNQLPPHHNDGQIDRELPPLNLTTGNKEPDNPKPIRRCLSNSFAFGGSNVCLLLAKIKDGENS